MICPACGAENLEGNDRCENCRASFRDLDVPSSHSAEGLARHVMEDTLAQLDHEAPILVNTEMPALEVARQMREANTGCALVVDGTRLVGIFTEHDLLRAMATAAGAQTQESSMQVAVKNLMCPDPETLPEHESIAFALNKMSIGRYRHVPIECVDGSYRIASVKSVLKYIAGEDW
jgi:CBS domain-containing protein